MKKFYLNDDAPAYSPAVAKGAWDDTTNQPDIGGAEELPSGASATLALAETTTTNNWDVLLATFVTAALANNVSFSTNDLITGVLAVLQSASGMHARTHVHIWVTTGNTDTVRGTLLNDFIGGTDWPTSQAGQSIGIRNVANNVNALAGDHIVIEVGYQAQNTVNTSFTGTLGFGTNDVTNTTDLTDGDTTWTTHASWISFSTNFGVEVVLLGSTHDTNSGSHTVTATPLQNDLIVIVTEASGNTADTLPTDNNASGGPYVQSVNPLKNSSADKMAAYVRTSPIQYKTSTNFTHNPGASTGGGLSVYAIRGMAKYGSAAVRQTAVQANHASGAAPAPAFGGAALTTNPIITAVFNATNPGGITAPTSFTRDVNTGYATPTSGFDSAHDNNGITASTITWGSSSGSAFCSLALELDGSAPTTLQNQTDTFPGSSLSSGADGSKWYDNTQTGGTQTVSGSAVHLTAPATTANALAEVETNGRYTLIGSYALVQMTVTQVADVNAEAGLTVYHDEYGNQLQLIVVNGNLVAGYLITGVSTTVATIAYNAGNMNWIRIRESGGTIFYDYSADGKSWTNLGSVADTAIPWDLTYIRSSVLAYDGDSNATAEVGVFSNYNNPPAITATGGTMALMGVG